MRKAGSQALSVEPNATTTVTSGTATMVADLNVPLRGLVPIATAQGSSEVNLSSVQRHLRITSTVRTETLVAMQRADRSTPLTCEQIDERACRPRSEYDPLVNLVDELHAIASVFERARLRYAVCGGIAVTAHGAVRTTKDIDVVLEPEDVARAVELVRPLGYTFAALPMTFEEGTPRERHVQRVSKIVGTEHLMIDLLSADAALAGTLDDRLSIDLPEGTLTIVSRATLIRMKRLAGRSQDLADLEKLEAGDEG